MTVYLQYITISSELIREHESHESPKLYSYLYNVV